MNNPWLREGNWSYGAGAGLFITETPLNAKAFTKEAQEAIRKNILTSLEVLIASKIEKKEDQE